MEISFGPYIWIVTVLLMVGGVVGVALAVALNKPSSFPDRRSEAMARAPAEPATRPPAEPVDEKVLAARRAAYRPGVYVLIGLAVLTVIEFLVAIALGGSAVFLLLIALVKAAIIIQYYMHLGRVWGEEEAHA